MLFLSAQSFTPHRIRESIARLIIITKLNISVQKDYWYNVESSLQLSPIRRISITSRTRTNLFPTHITKNLCDKQHCYGILDANRERHYPVHCPPEEMRIKRRSRAPAEFLQPRFRHPRDWRLCTDDSWCLIAFEIRDSYKIEVIVPQSKIECNQALPFCPHEAA